MEETPVLESWRDNQEIVDALDRLILKSAPELNIIMSALDDGVPIKDRAHGNMGIAFAFCLSLFTVIYERVRRENPSPLEAWDAAAAAVGGHPLTQQVMARSAAAVIDRQTEGVTE